MTLTVFVSTFNRLDTLERTVTSYRRLDTPHELVIVDNGTDHPKCVELLERIAKFPEVRKVYPLGKIKTMVELTENFNVAMRDVYASAKETDWFAVTDADICFDGADPGTLDTFLRLAKAIDNAVGPHLRVDDGIGAGYPLRSRVLADESRLVYRRAMLWHDGIPYSPLPIDTTFHLFPATNEFRRLWMNTVRVGHPYDAMHLDWYMDVLNPTEENAIYIPSGWSWGGSWILDFWRRLQDDAEAAFWFLLSVPRPPTTLCNVSFMISWCLQFGVGTDLDLDESRRWLRSAISRDYEAYRGLVEDDWIAFIYDGNFAALGW